MLIRSALSLPSNTRLTRLSTWLRLTIVWFCAHALQTLAPNTARRWLARYRRHALILLVVCALKRTPPPTALRRHGGLPRCRKLTIRRIAGAAVRRTLKSHRSQSGAYALYAALAKPERLILGIVRRLMRRFTKLRTRAAPECRCAPFTTLRATPAHGDTS